MNVNLQQLQKLDSGEHINTGQQPLPNMAGAVADATPSSPVTTIACANHNNVPGTLFSNAGSIDWMDRYWIQMLLLIQGVRCYTDASLTPDHAPQPPRSAGLGIFFVNPQVRPTQTIYIKAHVSGVHSVLMAEAAALALAATISDHLNYTNTTFLSDCQQLVQFLNEDDQSHPPD